MLKVEKMINMCGDEIFYIATDIGAIEISLRNGCDIYWNFVGLKYDRYSNDEVSLMISYEDNDDVCGIFEKLFADIDTLDEKVKTGMLSHCFLGKDANKVYKDGRIVLKSDDVISSNANSLIIEKTDVGYYVTFKKSKNMDGYLNRSFRVKIKNIGCRNAPLNLAFMDLYKELLKIDDIDKKDQKAYTLRKKYETSLVAQ